MSSWCPYILRVHLFNHLCTRTCTDTWLRRFQNWKLLLEHRRLCVDGFAQDTELQLVCIAAGSLIAGPQRDRLAAVFCLGGHVVDPFIIFCIIKLYWSHKGLHLGSPAASRTIKNGSLVQRDGEFDMLAFSSSQLLPRMLPWHSLQFHSTSFNFLTVREARGQEVHLLLPSRPSVLH